MSTQLLAQMMKWLLLPYRREFLHALKSPQRRQARLLREIMPKLAGTEYGRLFKANAQDTYAEFAKKIPIVNYDKIRHWIERQRETERSIIVAESVLFYEKTSGSSGPVKFIPYTKSLKRSFYKMFAISFGDILWSNTKLSKGKTFASISPQFADIEQSEQGRPIGLEDDAEYLDGALKSVVRRYSAIPSSIKQLQNPDDFKHVLATLLVAEANLEIVSIWNPTFFEIVLEYIEQHKIQLSEDLQRGVIKRQALTFEFTPISPKRHAALMQDNTSWQTLWPHLKLISCWTSAHAAAPAKRLQERFPNVLLQSKGLLSTEAPMTISMLDANGFLPFISEVFFEFVDDKNQIRLVHELEIGQEYELIVTQKAGLYRYRVGDRVKATHIYHHTPCLEFVGRADAVCDMVGEKLNEIFVRGCIEQVISQTSAFSLLLPAFVDGKKPHYCLITDHADDAPHDLSTKLDEALSKAFHYRNARKLGQLESVRVHVHPRAKEVYFRYLNERGVKLGDIKNSSLLKNTEQATEFLSTLRVM